MKKNVLYISYDGLTDNLGQSQILPYLNRISKNNFKFHLITCDKQEKLLKRKEHVNHLLANADIDWRYAVYHKRPPMVSTWYDLRTMHKIADEIVLSKDIQLIHCRSYPAMSIGLKLKRKFGIPLIFDMRGFYPEERVEGGIWNLSNPLYKWVFNRIKKNEVQYLEESNAIVSLTHNGKKELLERGLQIENSKIWVIPCAADYDHFKVIDSIPKENEMVYLGSTRTWYLLDEMLSFFKVFKEAQSTWKLRFITTDNKDRIIKKAKELGILESDISIAPCLREDLPKELNKAKFSLFFIKPSYSKTASYPTKMAESLACGLPVICNENVGDLDIFAERHPFIKAIKIDQNEFEKVSQSFESWNIFSPYAIREKTEGECGLDGAVDLYLDIYKKLTTN